MSTIDATAGIFVVCIFALNGYMTIYKCFITCLMSV